MAKIDAKGGVTVIAKRVGFDGLQIRQAGDIFTVPEATFQGIADNEARRQRAYKRALDRMRPGDEEPLEPRPVDCWFQRYTPGAKEGKDLV